MAHKRSDYNPIELYYDEYTNEQQERLEALEQTINHYRTKTTKCGRITEVDIYPIGKWGVGRKEPAQRTSEAQRNINHRNVQRKVTQLLNANFKENDIWWTAGYKNNPENFDEANARLKAMVKVLKRLIIRVNDLYFNRYQISFFEERERIVTQDEYYKALAEYHKNKKTKANFITIAVYLSQKIDKPLEELKYVYVTECTQKGRFHHHAVINFPFRECLEQMWKFGERNHTRRVQPDEDFGLEGLARYITKDYKYKKDYEKSFSASLNLYKPYKKGNYTTNETKCSRKQAREMTDTQKCFAWFVKEYPKLELVELPEIKINPYFGGYYIYARLKEATNDPRTRT